jgi:hypothetical protein
MGAGSALRRSARGTPRYYTPVYVYVYVYVCVCVCWKRFKEISTWYSEVRHTSYVICYMVYVIRCMSYVIFHMSYVMCHTPYVIRYMSYGVCHMSYVMRHASWFIRHTSYTIRHTLYVIRHMSYALCHMSYVHPSLHHSITPSPRLTSILYTLHCPVPLFPCSHVSLENVPMFPCSLVPLFPCSPIQLQYQYAELMSNAAVQFPSFTDRFSVINQKDPHGEFVMKRKIDLEGFFRALFGTYPSLVKHPKVIEFFELGKIPPESINVVATRVAAKTGSR